MKNIIWYLSAALFIANIVLIACQKDPLKNDQSLYAPNGLLVSKSSTDLMSSIASAMEINAADMTLSSIQYLDVSKGYIAEVWFHDRSIGGARKVYYISEEIMPEIKFDTDLARVQPKQVSDRLVKEFVVYCSCGTSNSSASNLCTPSVVVTPGSVSGSCSSNGCAWGCYVHMITPS